MQYCNCVPKILVEKYLGTEDGILPNDYKLYCFDGTVKAILVIADRNKDMRAGFYDTKWGYHDVKNCNHKSLRNVLKPQSLEQMIECAEKLSRGIPFVRIDFYEINGNPIFGEMTFSPAAGFYVYDVDIDGHSMGDYIDLGKDYPLVSKKL